MDARRQKKLFVPLKKFAEKMKFLLRLILQNYQHTKLLPLKQPFGAYPSYLHSFYQRDEKYYANHSNNTKDALKTKEWLQSTIYNHNDFNSYLHSLPDDLLKKLEWDNS